ncbi:putative phosphatidylinositol anchor biosynthesis protein PIGW/GWT1 [Helianthus debilis subsp. tardiflorus]
MNGRLCSSVFKNIRLWYWGLHLIGVWLGNNVLFRKNANGSARKQIWILVIFFWYDTYILLSKHFLFLSKYFFSILLSDHISPYPSRCLTLILDRFVERPSRRMCNVTYITLILATNLQMLGVITLSDYIPGGKLSLLEQGNQPKLACIFHCGEKQRHLDLIFHI